MKLIWPIRQSFTDYVRGNEGAITLDGVIETEDGFVFEGAAGDPPSSAADALAFSGSVHFEAHGGMLDVTIGDPVLTIDGESGTITVTTEPTGNSRTTLARLVEVHNGDVTSAKVLLTFEGTRLLGDVYAPGSPLDAFRIEDRDA